MFLKGISILNFCSKKCYLEQWFLKILSKISSRMFKGLWLFLEDGLGVCREERMNDPIVFTKRKYSGVM